MAQIVPDPPRSDKPVYVSIVYLHNYTGDTLYRKFHTASDWYKEPLDVLPIDGQCDWAAQSWDVADSATSHVEYRIGSTDSATPSIKIKVDISNYGDKFDVVVPEGCMFSQRNEYDVHNHCWVEIRKK